MKSVKKNILLSIACTLIAFSSMFIYSCRKSTETPSNNNISNSIGVHNRLGDPSILFTEDVPFEVDVRVANQLGYQKLIIKAGEYEVNFSENEFGSVRLNIDDANSIKIDQSIHRTTASNSNGIGIRIAKVQQKNRTCTCCGGIGFNCGFVSVFDTDVSFNKFIENPPTDPRVVFAVPTTSANTFILAFQNNINWNYLAE